jgi:hypothetical protein
MNTPYPILDAPLIAENSAPEPTSEPSPLSHLTPEEQMALFEAELKLNDWGHQPG